MTLLELADDGRAWGVLRTCDVDVGRLAATFHGDPQGDIFVELSIVTPAGHVASRLELGLHEMAAAADAVGKACSTIEHMEITRKFAVLAAEGGFTVAVKKWRSIHVASLSREDDGDDDDLLLLPARHLPGLAGLLRTAAHDADNAALFLYSPCENGRH